MRINKFSTFINEDAAEKDLLAMRPARFFNLIDFLECDISTLVEEDMHHYKFSTGLTFGELMELYMQFGKNIHKAEFIDKLKKQYCDHNKTEWSNVEIAAKEVDESMNEDRLSNSEAISATKDLGISLEVDYKPKGKQWDNFKRDFVSVIPTAKFTKNGLVLIESQYMEHAVAVLQLLGIGSGDPGFDGNELREGKVFENDGGDIRLYALVDVSRNCRITQSVLEAVNSKFDAEEKRDFLRWLQIIAEEKGR